MKIQDALSLMQVELKLNKTTSGRSVSELGRNAIQATIDDQKNYQVDAIKCLNCGFVCSSLIVETGCPNCGGLDLTTIIEWGVYG